MAWEKANHRNVVRLFGFYIDQKSFDEAWLLSWWQDEGNILQYIERTNPDTQRKLELVRGYVRRGRSALLTISPQKIQDTADGVAYLHELNPAICHGDIKPV